MRETEPARVADPGSTDGAPVAAATPEGARDSEGAGALAAEAVALASRLGVRVATAESLTGGLLAATIVDVPGASRAFSGGVVAYDTALKASVLGVDEGLLAERGPVDSRVAEQMARGAREACAVAGPADIGISTTGVAGPLPDPQTGQAAGTVWVGVSSAAGERAVSLGLSPAGTRETIRRQTVRAALEVLLAELGNIDPAHSQVS